MNKPEIIVLLINKALGKLDSARLLMENDMYDDAVSRAYYGVFTALTAILYTKSLAFSSHGQVLGAFNREFVKSGLFPAEIVKQINGLYEDRQTGDYEPGPGIRREVAEIHLLNAGRIVDAIVAYIGSSAS